MHGKGFLVEDENPPEQPEPLGIYYQLQLLSVPYWVGGLHDQPVILMRELNACLRAINEAEAQKSAALAAQLAMAQKPR